MPPPDNFGHGRQFERAINARDLGPLGDPERWGGHSECVMVIPPLANAMEVAGAQIIRVQCKDLIARAWDWAAAFKFSFDGDWAKLLNPVSGLRFTWGAGQNTCSGVWNFQQSGGFGASLFAGWYQEPDAGFVSEGVSASPWPLPAVSIAVVPFLRIGKTDEDTLVNTMRLAVDMTVSPRSIS